MSMAISAPHIATWYPKTTHFPAGRLRPTGLRVSASSSSWADDPKGKKLEYTPWLIVGLGNPGTNYHGTRFVWGGGGETSSIYELQWRISMISDLMAVISAGHEAEWLKDLLVAIPLWGKPALSIALHYDNMAAISVAISWTAGCILQSTFAPHLVDDLAQWCIKASAKSRTWASQWSEECYATFGWAKGVSSTMHRHWEPTMDMKPFLLQKFSPTERTQIDEALEQGIEAVRSLVLSGFNDRVTRFNLGQKYKYHKV